MSAADRSAEHAAEAATMAALRAIARDAIARGLFADPIHVVQDVARWSVGDGEDGETWQTREDALRRLIPDGGIRIDVPEVSGIAQRAQDVARADAAPAEDPTPALVIHHPDAEADPYPLDHAGDLADAIRAEAEIVAQDAGSDLLESPSQEHRDMLAARIVSEATRALESLHGGPLVGAEYRDPAGIRWSIVADVSEARR